MQAHSLSHSTHRRKTASAPYSTSTRCLFIFFKFCDWVFSLGSFGVCFYRTEKPFQRRHSKWKEVAMPERTTNERTNERMEWTKKAASAKIITAIAALALASTLLLFLTLRRTLFPIHLLSRQQSHTFWIHNHFFSSLQRYLALFIRQHLTSIHFYVSSVFLWHATSTHWFQQTDSYTVIEISCTRISVCFHTIVLPRWWRWRRRRRRWRWQAIKLLDLEYLMKRNAKMWIKKLSNSRKMNCMNNTRLKWMMIRITY